MYLIADSVESLNDDSHADHQEFEVKIAKVEDLITLDPEQTEVDLNHGRIGKIENFEPLVNLER